MQREIFMVPNLEAVVPVQMIMRQLKPHSETIIKVINTKKKLRYPSNGLYNGHMQPK